MCKCHCDHEVYRWMFQTTFLGRWHPPEGPKSLCYVMLCYGTGYKPCSPLAKQTCETSARSPAARLKLFQRTFRPAAGRT